MKHPCGKTPSKRHTRIEKKCKVLHRWTTIANANSYRMIDCSGTAPRDMRDMRAQRETRKVTPKSFNFTQDDITYSRATGAVRQNRREDAGAGRATPVRRMPDAHGRFGGSGLRKSMPALRRAQGPGYPHAREGTKIERAPRAFRSRGP